MIWGVTKDNSGKNSLRQSKFDITSHLDGKLFGSETIIIEGRLDGEILVKGSVEITRSAKINGNIKANKLSISGRVEGNIDVADSLLVEKIAIIHGDIKAGVVTITLGAIINGQCSFGRMPDNLEGDHIIEQHNAVLTNAY